MFNLVVRNFFYLFYLVVRFFFYICGAMRSVAFQYDDL